MLMLLRVLWFCYHFIYKLPVKTNKTFLEKKMLPESFLVFEKYFIFTEVSETSKTKSRTENVSSMIYESFVLELYCGTFHFGISIIFLLQKYEIRTGLLSNHFLRKNMIVEENLRVIVLKSNVFQLSHGIKNVYGSML